MQPTNQQTVIRDTTQYISGSVHYHRRKLDGKFEIVANLYHTAREALGLSIGGEVVLDVQPNRQDALESVRFFRGHQDNNKAKEAKQ